MIGELWKSPVVLTARNQTQSGAPGILGVRGLSVKSQIHNSVAETALTVTFENTFEATIEGDLVLPLPPTVALVGLTVRVGSRLLIARFRKRERAHEEYERATLAQQTAVLGETEGEDLARFRVAPIAAGEQVTVELSLVHLLLPVDDGHRMVLPLTYMPRFVEGTENPIEAAANNRARPLTSQAKAHLEIAFHHHQAPPPSLRCLTHPTVTRVEESTTTVVVEEAPLDRDFHLEIQDRPLQAPRITAEEDPQGGPDGMGPATVISISPPAFAEEGPTAPRTVTFLVDRSGSMEGGPMQSAIRAVRGALRGLSAQDRFNVIAFDNTLCALARQAVPFTDTNLKQADAFANALVAQGGTNASVAMAAALAPALEPSVPTVPGLDDGVADGLYRLNVVVFMTDGDVTGAEQILAQARSALVNTRVFVVGIGQSVNHTLLASLATAGGGAYFPTATDEDLERTLNRLKAAVHAPVWTDITPKLVSPNGDIQSPAQLEPQGRLDLFGSRPLLLAFRGALPPATQVRIDAQGPDGQYVRITVPIQKSSVTPVPAATVWALLKNHRLTYRFDEADTPALEELGADFGVANRAVALIAVDPEHRDVQVEASLAVSLPLPANIAPAFQAPTGFGAVPSAIACAVAPSPSGGSSKRRAPSKAAPSFPMASAPVAFDSMSGSPAAPPPMVPPPAPRMAAPVMAAPVMAALVDAEAETERSLSPGIHYAFTRDERGLRRLILEQSVDGRFGSPEATLAAVGAFLSLGHSHREGLFRSELRRTLATVKNLAATDPSQRAWLFSWALLAAAAGDPLPAGLPATFPSQLAVWPKESTPELRQWLRGAIESLLGVPSDLLAQAILAAFL